MKKISTMLFALLLMAWVMDVGAQLNQDWKWQNPLPQGNTIRWIKYWDANNWYAIGFAGTFMKTTNAGVNWTFHHKAGGQYLAYTGQSINMYDAHFFNQNTGVVVGSASVNGGITRTTNGGTTWDTAYSSTVTTGIFYQVQFLNNNVGYAVGTVTPKIWKTLDGGITWTGITTAPTTTMYDIHAFDTLNLVVTTTSGNVQKSTDGGATWSAVISTGNTSINYKMHFTNSTNGYVAGSGGKFSYTTNAGANWTLMPVIVGTTNTSSYYDIAAVPVSNPPVNLVSESFDGTTFPPTGWLNTQISGTGLWTRVTAGVYPTCTPHSGAGMTSFASYDYSSTTTAALISTSFSLVGSPGVKFGFWMYRDAGYSTSADRVVAMINDSASATYADTLGTINRSKTLYPVQAGADGWYYYEFSLPGTYTGATNYVILKAISEYGNNMFLDDIAVFKPASSGSKVFLTGDAFYIYKTQNNGTSWDTVGFLGSGTTQPWTNTYYATSVSASGDTLITGGTYGLINRRLSASNTAVFTILKKAGITYDVWAQNSSATGLILGVGARTSSTVTADQVLRSTNGGLTWDLATFPTTAYGYLNSIHMINDNTGWACGSNTSLFKTTNGGSSWDSVPTPFTEASKILAKVIFVDANTGWVFSKTSMTGDSTIIKTTNGGTSWVKQTIGNALTGSGAQIYWADFVNANTGWIVNYTPRPYKTTNGGATWTKDSIVDAFGGFMYGVEMLDASTGYISGSSGRIYKTTNGGALWDTIANKPGGTSPTWYGIKFYTPWVGVAVGSNGMTITTSNGGANWNLQNTAGGTMYNVAIVPGSVGYTCGSSGYIWKNSNLPLVSGVQNQSELPQRYELSQNYPNPFNPTTTIKFAIPKAGIVTMKVYDVAGREVIKIINNQHYNAGYQTQEFNGTMLASGVYFYSLIVNGNLIDTKKMVLIK
ncbi:MAG: T9SS type A sorting domain-containing protein [Ignavibacteriae bacterium]|nr:T9SS type A sorting domain-containing protein [Ignavibacteriota bacterium]